MARRRAIPGAFPQKGTTRPPRAGDWSACARGALRDLERAPNTCRFDGSRGRIEGDESASDLNQGEVVVGDALPADEQTTELVVPGVGALDDPAARFAADAANHALLSATPDVRDDAASPNLPLAVGVVVSLVQAQVFRPAGPARSPEHQSVDRRAHHPLVVNVRSGQRHRQRNAARIRQDVPFRAGFRAIGGTGAGEVPPFGALTVALSIEHQVRSTPTCWS